MTPDLHPNARHWEDFRVGDRFSTAARTVQAAELAAFAELSGDHNPLHSGGDPVFGRPIAHGLLGAALAVGLVEETGIHHGTTIAMVGLTDWRFHAPLLAGESVRARMRVTATRPSSRPGRGVLTRRLELVDRHGVVLQSGETTLLVRARGGAGENG
ncbi:MaoC/PaaZ C-terminal domain-containing protein [Kitasatospora sp. NPDC056446]|uniref:MaoC/PaaZ C-terminal domain-containing protein n=1 Tax=Kitasatospora sp. NPDC056446 TaxID=3345819 RepID=UPI0036CD1AE4